MVQYPAATFIFPAASTLSPTVASKSEATQSTLLYKSCSNKKNHHGFVTETFKVQVTNLQGFFDLSNFYIIKLISQPPTLRLLWGSRLRLLGKWRWLLGFWTIGLSKTALYEKTFLNWRPLLIIYKRKQFLFDLNVEQHNGLKVRGSEINFII